MVFIYTNEYTRQMGFWMWVVHTTPVACPAHALPTALGAKITDTVLQALGSQEHRAKVQKNLPEAIWIRI